MDLTGYFWIVLSLLKGDLYTAVKTEYPQDKYFATAEACMVAAHIMAGQKTPPPVCKQRTGKTCPPNSTIAMWAPSCIEHPLPQTTIQGAP